MVHLSSHGKNQIGDVSLAPSVCKIVLADLMGDLQRRGNEPLYENIPVLELEFLRSDESTRRFVAFAAAQMCRTPAVPSDA
jgi:hypothetical protein